MLGQTSCRGPVGGTGMLRHHSFIRHSADAHHSLQGHAMTANVGSPGNVLRVRRDFQAIHVWSSYPGLGIRTLGQGSGLLPELSFFSALTD